MVITHWRWLDPVVALLVAANIIWTGVGIVRRSVGGLMDMALPEPEVALVRKALENYSAGGVRFHALRTRQSGAQKFVSVHVLVPGDWTVHRGHELLELIEADIRRAVPETIVFTIWNPSTIPRHGRMNRWNVRKLLIRSRNWLLELLVQPLVATASGRPR